MNRYKELKVWKESMEVTTMIYEVTDNFPADERFGLTSQIRRASVSIPSNIAEGAGRNSDGEFRQFLGIANASACELETQLNIASRLGLIDSELFSTLSDRIEHIQNMIFKLKQKLN